jgi:hypothetical protein
VLSHTDFWIVTGTASPVIALAAVVAARDATAVIPTCGQLGQDALPREIVRAGQTAMVSVLASWINLVVQLTVLMASLEYLRTGSEWMMPSGTAMWLEGAGIASLAVSAISALMAANHAKRAKMLARAAEPDELTSG